MNRDEFKSYGSLKSYCELTLGEGKYVGKELRFKCPFGDHKRPKLTINEKDGVGLWKCWACDESGDIFTLAAKLNGLDVKTQFKEVASSVSSTLGIPLYARPLPRGRAKRKKPFPIEIGAGTLQIEKPVFLSPEDEAELDRCRESLVTDEASRKELALELGINENELLKYVDQGYSGTLGITPDGRLLYLYRAKDACGKYRYTGAKLRTRINHENPFLKLDQGKWQSFGTMNPTEDKPDGIRFLWSIGKAYQPWGMETAENKPVVFVCEGESDALAINQAICEATEREHTRTNSNAPCLEQSKRSIHSVVAIPGVSSFPEEWISYFSGKVVVLCLDQDEAGRKGSQRITSLLEKGKTAMNQKYSHRTGNRKNHTHKKSVGCIKIVHKNYLHASDNEQIISKRVTKYR